MTGTLRARSLNDIAFEGQPLAELLKTGSYWIDVLAPTDVEMRMISKVGKAYCFCEHFPSVIVYLLKVDL